MDSWAKRLSQSPYCSNVASSNPGRGVYWWHPKAVETTDHACRGMRLKTAADWIQQNGVGQPSWICAPLEISRNALFHGIAFQLPFVFHLWGSRNPGGRAKNCSQKPCSFFSYRRLHCCPVCLFTVITVTRVLAVWVQFFCSQGRQFKCFTHCFAVRNNAVPPFFAVNKARLDC